MARATNGDRQRHWQEVIERQRASGRSIVGFCMKEGLSPASFHAWKRRLRRPRRKAGQKAAQALLPVQVVDAIPSIGFSSGRKNPAQPKPVAIANGRHVVPLSPIRCVCHAVRAPGSHVTAAAVARRP